MITRFRKIINASLASIYALSMLAAPIGMTTGVVLAQRPDIQNNLCAGGGNLQFGTQGNCRTDGAQAERSVNALIAQIINIFSVIVGIVAVIMIIVGGFRYITSGGDSGNVTSAKNTILYAIVGLVIVALAQFIVKFILSKATTVQ